MPLSLSSLSLPDSALISAEQVAAALHLRLPITDRAFDRFLPAELRAVSCTYWTPVAVAQRVAEWLADLQVTSVVDVGSGAGKFCVVAALATRCDFIGVEHREHLVDVARELAAQFALAPRVSFRVGTLSDVPLAAAYYLYNPFSENRCSPAQRLDDKVELNRQRFIRDVTAMETLLDAAPRGTYVITYNGFGGEIPGTYRQVHVDYELSQRLELWLKTMDDAELHEQDPRRGPQRV